MVVQILATADNHLDFSAALFGPKRYERKEDFQRCFLATMDYAKKEKPDIVLIAGDLFDTINPRNPPRSLLMKTFRSLHEQGIRVFAISGHHDTPKSQEEGVSPLTIYGDSGYVTFCQNFTQPTNVSFQSRDGDQVGLSGLSFNPLAGPNVDPLERLNLRPNAKINILMVHYPISGFKGYYANESFIRPSSIPKGFQLTVAGHLHAHQLMESHGSTIAYPGSTERTSFSEETEEKGFLWIDLGSDGPVSKPEFIPTPARKLETVEFALPEEGDITSLIKSEIEKRKNRNLVLRVRLVGKVSVKSLATYRRPVLQAYGSEFFFHVIVDETRMQIERGEPLDTLPRATPLEELKNYFENEVTKASPTRKQDLREAYETASSLLEELGAW